MKKMWVLLLLAITLIGCESKDIELKTEYENFYEFDMQTFYDALFVEMMDFDDYLTSLSEEPEPLVEEPELEPEEPEGIVILDDSFVYSEPLEIELEYEMKDDGRYIAKIDYFHITVYGQPSILVTYCVDYMIKTYETYLSWFELSYVPQVRLHFFYDVNQFADENDPDDYYGYLAYQSAQSIFFKMPSIYSTFGYSEEEKKEMFVYQVGPHELMHIMQYNANNFSLGFYKEPFLLEAMAEYGVYAFNGYKREEFLEGHRLLVDEMEDFRLDDGQYEYIYGEYFMEYLLTLKEDITVHDILLNPDFSEFFMLTEEEIYDGWEIFMMEKHGVIIDG